MKNFTSVSVISVLINSIDTFEQFRELASWLIENPAPEPTPEEDTTVPDQTDNAEVDATVDFEDLMMSDPDAPRPMFDTIGVDEDEVLDLTTSQRSLNPADSVLDQAIEDFDRLWSQVTFLSGYILDVHTH